MTETRRDEGCERGWKGLRGRGHKVSLTERAKRASTARWKTGCGKDGRR